MTKEDPKTPEELAEEEVNKIIAKSLANRKLEIKQHKARIKKLEKEIRKIIDGELVPDEEDYPPSDSKDIIIKSNIIINTQEKKKKEYDYGDWNSTSYKFHWYDDSTSMSKCLWNSSTTAITW